MSKKIILTLLSSVIIIASYGYAIKTKPNPIFDAPYPSKFSCIQKNNPLLAKEIKKLPELQDGLSDTDNDFVALERISELYEQKNESFDKAFLEMYTIGLPDVRRYCTPLQALFWLIQDNKMDQAISILSNYSLSDILDVAWNFEQHIFTDQKLKLIVSNIKEQKLREEYEYNIMYNVKRNVIEKWILKDYEENRKVFNSEAQEAIKSHLKNPEDPRWKSFKDVTERLNSPELIDYFEKRRFRYIPWETIPGYKSNESDPYWIFKNNGGNCVYTTNIQLP